MSSVNAVYVSLNASWSRQCKSLFLKRDIQGVFAWLWVPMTRIERRRVWRNMLEDLEIMCGQAMWSVRKLMKFHEKEEREKEQDLLLYVRVRRCVTCGNQMAR